MDVFSDDAALQSALDEIASRPVEKEQQQATSSVVNPYRRGGTSLYVPQRDLSVEEFAHMAAKKRKETYMAKIREAAGAEGAIVQKEYGGILYNMWRLPGSAVPVYNYEEVKYDGAALTESEYSNLTLGTINLCALGGRQDADTLRRSGIDRVTSRGISGKWDGVNRPPERPIFLNTTYFVAVHNGDGQKDALFVACFYSNREPRPYPSGIGPVDPEWETYTTKNNTQLKVDGSMIKDANALLMLKSALEGTDPSAGSFIWMRPIVPDMVFQTDYRSAYWGISGASFGLALRSCILGGAPVAYTGSSRYIEPGKVLDLRLQQSGDGLSPDNYSYDTSATTQGVIVASDVVEPVRDVFTKSLLCLETKVPFCIPMRDEYNRPMDVAMKKAAQSIKGLEFRFVHGAYNDVWRYAGRSIVEQGSRLFACNDENDALRYGYFAASTFYISADAFKIISKLNKDEVEYFGGPESQGLLAGKQLKEKKARIGYERRFDKAAIEKFGTAKKLKPMQKRLVREVMEKLPKKKADLARLAQVKEAKSAAKKREAELGVTRAAIKKRAAYSQGGINLLRKAGARTASRKVVSAEQDLEKDPQNMAKMLRLKSAQKAAELRAKQDVEQQDLARNWRYIPAAERRARVEGTTYTPPPTGQFGTAPPSWTPSVKADITSTQPAQVKSEESTASGASQWKGGAKKTVDLSDATQRRKFDAAQRRGAVRTQKLSKARGSEAPDIDWSELPDFDQ